MLPARNTIWVLAMLLFTGCEAEAPKEIQKTEIARPSVMGLILPAISLRWIGTSADKTLIETTLKGTRETVFVSPDVIVDGTHIDSAVALPADDGKPAVMIKFTAEGGRRIYDATKVPDGHRIALVIDGAVVLTFAVETPVENHATISGDISEDQAEEIAAQIERLIKEESRAGGQVDTNVHATDTVDLNDAHRVVDQAIATLGGPQGRSFLRRGSMIMEIHGEMPGLSQQFGTDTLTFAAQFDLPDFERREIYGDSQQDHMLIITNSGTMWSGNQNGVGRSMPAPPPQMYRGPFLVGIIQYIIELRETTSRLNLQDDTSGATTLVVDAYFPGDLFGRRIDGGEIFSTLRCH
ncbi:MAG TPA: hypothetical protein PLR25_07160, partial [Planctomycetaceae bacterium]|nr:hypothetical protein [Planctomycetaceae bacterium]